MSGIGQAWEAKPLFYEPTPLVDGLEHITAGGNGFVAWGATADGSDITASGADLSSWGEAGTPGQFGGQTIDGMANGPEGMVAVGHDATRGNRVWRSTDGMSWKAITGVTGIDGVIGAVTTFSGSYVAAGTTRDGCGLRAWLSLDGRTWRASRPLPGTIAGCVDAPLILFLARGGPGGLLAFGIVRGAGGVGAAFWTSRDGISWTIHPQPSLGGDLGGFTAGGPGYVAVGASGAPSHAVVWTSSDGATWSAVPDQPSLENAFMNDVAALADGTLVAVGTAREAAHGASHFAVWTSADGLTWQRAPASVNSNDPRPYPDDADVFVRQLASDGQRLVAIGTGTNGVWVSPRVTPGLRSAALTVTLSGRLERSAGAVSGTCRDAQDDRQGTLMLATVTDADGRTYALNFTVAPVGILSFIFYGDPPPAIDVDTNQSGQGMTPYLGLAAGSTGDGGTLDFHDLIDRSAPTGPTLSGTISWSCGA